MPIILLKKSQSNPSAKADGRPQAFERGIYSAAILSSSRILDIASAKADGRPQAFERGIHSAALFSFVISHLGYGVCEG
ncbi:MAG: hypothetical protein KDD73_17445, partial [Anaerolineales bacterium]|nr:hypothetical protein [Anaerolineales bacterium]